MISNRLTAALLRDKPLMGLFERILSGEKFSGRTRNTQFVPVRDAFLKEHNATKEDLFAAASEVLGPHKTEFSKELQHFAGGKGHLSPDVSKELPTLSGRGQAALTATRQAEKDLHTELGAAGEETRAAEAAGNPPEASEIQQLLVHTRQGQLDKVAPRADRALRDSERRGGGAINRQLKREDRAANPETYAGGPVEPGVTPISDLPVSKLGLRGQEAGMQDAALDDDSLLEALLGRNPVTRSSELPAEPQPQLRARIGEQASTPFIGESGGGTNERFRALGQRQLFDPEQFRRIGVPPERDPTRLSDDELLAMLQSRDIPGQQRIAFDLDQLLAQ